MGDGGGNLVEQIRSVEEQIRSMEEQIRSMEEQIRSMEEQIRRVEKKIERVEQQIDRCPSEVERKQLRDKEAQLRDKKAQLRDKEAQLRDKEAQLRDEKAQLRGEEAQLRRKEGQLWEQILLERGKCTEFDWLRQELPPWDSEGCSTMPSATQTKRMYRPLRVEYWDVVKDIEDYLNKANKLKRMYQNVDNPIITTGRRNVVAVAICVVGCTCAFVSKKQSGSLVMYELKSNLEVPPKALGKGGISTNPDESETEEREEQKCVFYASPPHVDILVKSNGKGIAAFELKNGGLGCPVPIHELWGRCSCRTGSNPNCWCKSGIERGHAKSILNCILQVYEYLVLAKVEYGVLTDIQNWYLLKRDRTGCLYISVCFKWNDRQPPLPAAIAYLVSCAVDARGEFDISPRKGEDPWSWEDSPCTSPSGGSKDDKDKDRTYRPKEREIGGHRTSPARTREACSNMRQQQLHEIPASDLHLDDRPITSAGWSGCVVGGTLNGRRVAVKFAFRDSERAEALLNEVRAYLKLKEHWGIFVPTLVGYGTTAGGRVIFIATELIDGSQLGPGTVTEEVASAALQALGAVHACKVLHGDVEARNIMVVRDTQPSVRLVDFGFSQCSSNRRSRKAELRHLQRLLQDTMAAGVGKAAVCSSVVQLRRG